MAGLAYMAAFAPSPGQSLADVAQQGPAASGGQHFTVDAAGFVRMTRQGMDEDLAHDVPAAERRLLFATQQPLAAATCGEKVTAAAWQSKPSWYFVSEHDRILNPELQRSMAQKIQANTRSVAVGHLPMLSQPDQVAAFVVEAAQQAGAH